MELPKLVATLPYPKMVAGAPSICLRDNCSQVPNTNRLSVAQAAATAAAVTAVVAGAVAAGVASGVAAGAAGGREFKKSGSELLYLINFRKLTLPISTYGHDTSGAAGGAGGGGGGGGGGGLVLLIDQVQFMNIAGRVSGSGAGEGLAAFSEGFGWANFDFPVGAGGGGGDKNVSRRQERREEHCQLEQGTPLLKKLVTCFGIICAVFSLRVLGGRVYMWYKKEVRLVTHALKHTHAPTQTHTHTHTHTNKQTHTLKHTHTHKHTHKFTYAIKINGTIFKFRVTCDTGSVAGILAALPQYRGSAVFDTNVRPY
jgi:hypothetical protein